MKAAARVHASGLVLAYPAAPGTPAPWGGEHPTEVLAEIDDEDERIADLAAAGVVRLGTPVVYRPLPVYR